MGLLPSLAGRGLLLTPYSGFVWQPDQCNSVRTGLWPSGALGDHTTRWILLSGSFSPGFCCELAEHHRAHLFRLLLFLRHCSKSFRSNFSHVWDNPLTSVLSWFTFYRWWKHRHGDVISFVVTVTEWGRKPAARREKNSRLSLESVQTRRQWTKIFNILEGKTDISAKISFESKGQLKNSQTKQKSREFIASPPTLRDVKRSYSGIKNVV